MSEQETVSRMEVRVHPVHGWLVTRWHSDERWQFVGGTNDGEVIADEQVEGWTELVPKPAAEQERPRAIRELFREVAEQEAVSGEAAAVLVGSVDSAGHGSVQAELRRVQVAVRGQMDGIRPIEAVVLTYRWTTASGGWVFEELQPLVQGLDGTLKPGTVLSAEDFHMLGPSLGWAWELGHAYWPRG